MKPSRDTDPNEPEPRGDCSGERSRKRILPLIFTCLVLAAFTVFLAVNLSYLAEHFTFNPVSLGLIAIIHAAVIFVRSTANAIFFRSFGVTAPVVDWFRLDTVAAMTNYLPVSMGLFAKGFLLKRVYGLRYRLFAAGQSLLFVVFLVTNGTIGLLVLNFCLGLRSQWIVQILLLAMVAAGVILLLPARITSAVNEKLSIDPDTMGQVRRRIPVIILIQSVIQLLLAASLYLCFGLGGLEVSYFACLLFAATAILARLAPLTPGALGIQEFLTGGIALLAGFDLRDAVLAASISRIVSLIVVFGLGSLFSYRLAHQVGDAGSEDAAGKE